MRELVFGRDQLIAEWAFRTFKRAPTPYAMAVGIVDPQVGLVGAILFQEYNGSNAELSYYGERTLSASIVRAIATIACDQLNVLRLTVRVMKRHRAMTRSLSKFGFRYEGQQPFFYGAAKGDTAVLFGIYRDGLERLKRR